MVRERILYCVCMCDVCNCMSEGVQIHFTVAHSLVCKATVPIHDTCVLCALFQWESNCFINPLCNLLNVRVLGPCEPVGLLPLAFTKHTLTHFHTLSKRWHIQTLEWGLPWRLARSTETAFSHNPERGFVKLGNTRLQNIYSHIYLSPLKPLYCKGSRRHHLLNLCTFLHLFVFLSCLSCLHFPSVIYPCLLHLPRGLILWWCREESKGSDSHLQ